MATQTLPVLALPHPLSLLPSGRITLPVQRAIGETLLTFVQEAETAPVIAAVPVTSPNGVLNQWGTVARVVRLIRPQPRNPRQPFLLTLTGLSRVRLADSAPGEATPADAVSGIVERKVELPPADGIPNVDAVSKFKAAALKLLDQLARDSTLQAKRDSYLKVAAMVEETSQAKAPWMADVMVANVNGVYEDKLGELSVCLYTRWHSCTRRIRTKKPCELR